MLFHSQSFIYLFFPALLLGLFFAKRNMGSRNWVLLIFSLLFYTAWDWRFFLILPTSIMVNWLMIKSFQNKMKLCIFLGVGFNLLVLFIFKYFNFFFLNLYGLFSSTPPNSSALSFP